MKKTNKKFIGLLLTGALIAASLSGCSGLGGAASTNQSASASKTKVVVWTVNRHDLTYMNKVVDEFNKSHSDVQIQYTVQAENYENMIIMAASSGQMPDVMSQVAPNYLSQFASNGIIQPLDSYIASDAEFQKVNEVNNVKFDGRDIINGKMYWVPCGKRSGSRLIYNKQILSSLNLKVPTTMSDMVTSTKQITKSGAGKYYGVIFPGANSPFERWIEHSAEMSGVTPYNYVQGKYDFSGYKPFVEAVRKMFADKSVFPGSSSLKIDPSRVQFANGKAAFCGNASQEATVFTTQFPAKMEWGVAQLPTLDGTIKGAESCSPNNGWMMSASTKDAKAAWEVISYFGSEKVLKGYLEGGYTLPMSKYMEQHIDKSKVGRMADFSGATYESVYPVAPAVAPAGQNYEDVLWNACLSNGPDINKIIEQLNTNYNKALDQAVSMGKVKRLVIADFDPLHPDKGTAKYLTK